MKQCVKVVRANGKKILLELTFETTRVLRLQFDDESVQDRWENTFNEYMEDYKNSATGFSKYDQITNASFQEDGTIIKTDKGQVDRVVYKKNGMVYSCKMLLTSTLNSSEIEYIKSVHNNLKEHNSLFLMKTFASFEDSDLFFIMNEYPQTTLFTLMSQTQVPIPKIKLYAAELLLAIQEVHDCGYIHMEINPETIFIDNEGHLLLSTPVGLRCSYRCGYNYFAPEILEKKELTSAVDYWSLGVLIYAMAFGESPFYDTNPSVVCKNIINENVAFPETSNAEIEEFINELLRKDSTQRNCDLNSLKQLQFFFGMDFNQIAKKEVPISI